MANLPSTLQISKGDVFQVDPMQLVIDEEQVFTGRWKPVSDDVVRERAESFLEIGQQQPCRIRHLHGKGPNAVYALVAGFTRAKAAILISSDPDLRARAGLEAGKNYPLKVIRSNTNESTAVVENIVENAQRQETSPIDDAHNHEKLRSLGYTDADIARIVGMDPGKVSKLKKLLGLEERFQQQIHDGELSMEAGLGLMDIEPAKRDEVVTPEPDSEAAAKPVRERVKTAQREAGVVVRMTPRELKAFCDTYTAEECVLAEDTTTNAVMKDIIGLFQQLMAGELEEGEFLTEMQQLLDG